ncbi:MAG: NTP transferase domain-containing protein [Saprospiraceae bacterium]|nr:NTP transferase domain-containing protein [Saprospiraceae bacterium]
MKALIPVAGAGLRLRPHTYTQPKPLIPVAGKPILAHIIDELIAANFKEFVFVIGYLGEKVKDFVEHNYPNIHTTFVVQEEREGLAHAIWTAKDAIENDDELFIVLGDTVFEMDLSSMIESPITCFGVKEVADPRDFGIVELDGKGFVKRVIEKPRIPRSNLALVGLYKIHEVSDLLRGIEYNIQNDIRTNGEFQLADALQRMIDLGVKMTTVSVNNWFDCGKKEILLETNAILLQKNNTYDVDLPVFDNTIIVHPVSIGENCVITDSIIGPFVTVAANTKIDASIIRDSIIGSYSTLREIILNKSIIGSDTSIRGIRRSLNIGDNTEIDFS